jgi:uncharacterized protein YodC (DUF2158 family)
MCAIKKGDVVQLKSGSPNMTVILTGGSHASGETVQCIWYEGGKFTREWFTEEVLDLANYPTDEVRTALKILKKAEAEGA